MAEAVGGLVRVHGHVQHVGGVHGQDGVGELRPAGRQAGAGDKLAPRAPIEGAAKWRRPVWGRRSPRVQSSPPPSRPAPAPALP